MSSGVVNTYVKRKPGSNTLPLQRGSEFASTWQKSKTRNSETAWHSAHAISLCAAVGSAAARVRSHDDVSRMF